MSFAREDRMAWDASEVMAELEKIAKETGVLDGPPPEAFQPIVIEAEEKEPELEQKQPEPVQPADEQRADDAGIGVGELNGLTAAVKKGLKAMAYNLADAGMIKKAHAVECTLKEIEPICENIRAVAQRIARMGDGFLRQNENVLATSSFRLATSLMEKAAEYEVNKQQQQEEDSDAPHQS